jgi:hypothetical protein
VETTQTGRGRGCPIIHLGDGLLLVTADSAANVADPGNKTYLCNRRLICAWPRNT